MKANLLIDIDLDTLISKNGLYNQLLDCSYLFSSIFNYTHENKKLIISLKQTLESTGEDFCQLKLKLNKINELKNNIDLHSMAILGVMESYFNTNSTIHFGDNFIEGLNYNNSSGTSYYTTVPYEKWISYSTFLQGDSRHPDYATGINGNIVPKGGKISSWLDNKNLENDIEFRLIFPKTSDLQCSMTVTKLSFYILSEGNFNQYKNHDDIKAMINNSGTLYLPGELIEDGSSEAKFTKSGNLFIKNDFQENIIAAAYKNHFEAYELIEY